MTSREELLALIARLAADGRMSKADCDIRIANVRDASTEAELDLIRRDLERLVGAAPPPRYPSDTPTASRTSPLTMALGGAGRRTPPAEPGPFSVLRALGVVVSMFFVAVAITLAYWSMRAVLDVGGSCAQGGPYAIAQPCPDGTWVIAVAIPVLLISSLIGGGLAITVGAPSPLLVMWGALFGVLGWNFLEYGTAYSNAGLIVCGVLFWLMAAPAVVLVIGGAIWRAARRPDGTGKSVLSTLTWLALYLVVGVVGFWVGSGLWVRLAS